MKNLKFKLVSLAFIATLTGSATFSHAETPAVTETEANIPCQARFTDIAAA